MVEMPGCGRSKIVHFSGAALVQKNPLCYSTSWRAMPRGAAWCRLVPLKKRKAAPRRDSRAKGLAMSVSLRRFIL